MKTPSWTLPLAGLGALLACLCLHASPARADGCDATIAALIRGTGASFAGREGALAVFRAADAERMSLDCARRGMVFASLYRQPNRYYFVLIGHAARTLLRADAMAVETLAIQLNETTLVTGEPQEGRAGPARLRCEPGDRPDGFSDGALCRLAPATERTRRLRG